MSRPEAPDVTAVVIGYNDGARIGRAIRSVLDQTLRSMEVLVVDDASTDGTAEVVARLAAGDDRLRYVRLPENSGSGSAPRNLAIAEARAPWIIFLDSDDVYERHAMKNLLIAAEEDNADIACGGVVRVDAATGDQTAWLPELFDRRRFVGGIQDDPARMFDTISVSKLYSTRFLRDAGLQFPEGLLYEDQLFTMEAYAATRRLTVIPETCYRWYVDRAAERRSVTQSRHDLRNVSDRVEINRRIDAFLTAQGREDLRPPKDHKFVEHDLRLYLKSVIDLDDDTAAAILDVLRPYVETLPFVRFAAVHPALRVAVYHLLIGDVEGVRQAMRCVQWGSVLPVPIVRDGDVQWWGCDHLGKEDARPWLDVSGMHLPAVPWSQTRFLHCAGEWSASGRMLSVQGTTVDALQRIEPGMRAELVATAAGGHRLLTLPLDLTRVDDVTWRWQGRGRPQVDPYVVPDVPDVGGAWSVVLHAAEGPPNITAVRSTAEAPPLVLRVAPRRRWTRPALVSTLRMDRAVVGWRACAATAAGAWCRATVERARDTSLARRLTGLWELAREDLVLPAIRGLAGRLPRARTVVFEAFKGRSATDSPRAIADYLGEHRPDIRQVWSYLSTPEGFPEGASLVKRRSLRYYWRLSRSRWWVDNYVLPHELGKPRDTVYLQTGHGIPFKRMGHDALGLQIASDGRRQAFDRSVSRWDYLVAPGAYFEQVYVPAYGARCTLLGPGTPRNDRLVAGPDRATARRLLDLPAERTVVLYAPTFRDRDKTGAVPPIDLDLLADKLGEDVFVLVRAHYFNRFQVPSRLWWFARDVTDEQDLALLMQASDALVTDYSSVMFDFAHLGRPLVFFVPDYDDYVHQSRGSYFDLPEVAPGPVVHDDPGLVEALRSLPEWRERYGERWRAFVDTYCGEEDGHATERVVEAVFGDGR